MRPSGGSGERAVGAVPEAKDREVSDDPCEAPVAGKEPSACVKGGTCWEVRSYLSRELNLLVRSPSPAW